VTGPADNPPDGAPGPADEFDTIACLLRPLTGGAPEALGLLDDAAVLPARPGCDLVITKDMIVEGVHFLASDPLDLVARKLLRVNLSDLAAKGARPYAYFLAISWSPRCGWPQREAFAAGLKTEQDAFGLVLLGGDTTSTPGPLTASATLLGWVAAGGAVLRSGARAGDALLVSGVVGDGWLGLQAALGRAQAPAALQRYRLPEPRVVLAPALAFAHACADVSDGLIADAGRLALASGLAAHIELERVPLSAEGRAHVVGAPHPSSALIDLVTGGDDYELVCAAAPEQAPRLIAAARAAGVDMTVIGHFAQGQGAHAWREGRPVDLRRQGYRHI
jgi:thiamine-monophosphate kinase